jgi:AraC-like DNA-binding protein
MRFAVCRSSGEANDEAERAGGGLASWRAKRVRLYIEENLAQRLDTESLARITHVSRNHFCRAFKRTFGLTVHWYVVQRRVALAQHLMLTTSAPLSDVALACGMSDHSHLSRLFRRVVEESPAVWRKQNRRDFPAIVIAPTPVVRLAEREREYLRA